MSAKREKPDLTSAAQGRVVLIGTCKTGFIGVKTREVLRVDFCVATDEGFEYPEYTPAEEQMALFRKFAKECQWATRFSMLEAA